MYGGPHTFGEHECACLCVCVWLVAHPPLCLAYTLYSIYTDTRTHKSLHLPLPANVPCTSIWQTILLPHWLATAAASSPAKYGMGPRRGRGRLGLGDWPNAAATGDRTRPMRTRWRLCYGLGCQGQRPGRTALVPWSPRTIYLYGWKWVSGRERARVFVSEHLQM